MIGPAMVPPYWYWLHSCFSLPWSSLKKSLAFRFLFRRYP